MVLLSFIILSYNKAELVINCIESLLKQYKEELVTGEYEVLLVDNNSSDDTLKRIKAKKFPIKLFTVIENKENYGFAQGNNIGAQKASGKYLFFLNSDAEVLGDGIDKMIDFFETHEDGGIVGAKLVDSKGEQKEGSAGKFFSLSGVFKTLFLGDKRGGTRFTPVLETLADWVPGAAMMVKSDLYKKIDGFDPHFFMYVEDMDLCLRMKKYGFNTYYFPYFSVMHREQGSSNRAFAIIQISKNLLYYYKKHYSKGEYFMVKLMLVAKSVAAITVGLCLRDTYLTTTYKKVLRISL